MTEVKRDDILKVTTALTTEQIQKFFSETPRNKIKTRPARGGGTWDYVAGSYVTQVLNSLFGFNWSFEIKTSMEEAIATAKTGTIVVQGTLRVKIGDDWITKEQFGRKSVTYMKDGEKLLDFGNDLKAAATDAKKKCASELGLFADVYAREDFFEADILDSKEVTKVTKWTPSPDLEATDQQRMFIKNLLRQSGVAEDAEGEYLADNYGILPEAFMSQADAQMIVDDLNTKGE